MLLLLLLISTMIRVSGLTRIEPEASATATGTVPAGPQYGRDDRQADAGEIRKAIVSACSDASDLETPENARTPQYQAA